MPRGALVAFVSAALLLAGCGDDDTGSTANGDDRDVSTTNDQQIADQAIAAVEQSLRDSGFSGTVDNDENDDLAFESEECTEFEAALEGPGPNLPGETADADSEDFERGGFSPEGGVEENVSAFVGFVEETSDLNPVLDLLNDERWGPCVEEALRNEIEASAAEDQVDMAIEGFETEQLGSDGLGDTGGGLEITADISAYGFSVPFAFAFQVVQVDRALVGIVASAVGPDEPTADRAALLEVLVDAVSEEST